VRIAVRWRPFEDSNIDILVHTHNLFTPGGRAERATSASLTLYFLCYILVSAHISSLSHLFIVIAYYLRSKPLLNILARFFFIYYCSSSGARGLVLLVADWLRVGIVTMLQPRQISGQSQSWIGGSIGRPCISGSFLVGSDSDPTRIGIY
jgi:hypothetical protein